MSPPASSVRDGCFVLKPRQGVHDDADERDGLGGNDQGATRDCMIGPFRLAVTLSGEEHCSSYAERHTHADRRMNTTIVAPQCLICYFVQQTDHCGAQSGAFPKRLFLLWAQRPRSDSC